MDVITFFFTQQEIRLKEVKYVRAVRKVSSDIIWTLEAFISVFFQTAFVFPNDKQLVCIEYSNYNSNLNLYDSKASV